MDQVNKRKAEISKALQSQVCLHPRHSLHTLPHHVHTQLPMPPHTLTSLVHAQKSQSLQQVKKLLEKMDTQSDLQGTNRSDSSSRSRGGWHKMRQMRDSNYYCRMHLADSISD